MRRFLNTYALAVAMLAAIVFRLALGLGMPLNVHAGASYDDAWAVRAASFVADGVWLGPYDDTTLVKAPGFPLFLALAQVRVLGYGLVLTLLWTASCLVLVIAVRPLLRSRKTVFLVFAVLLFCPVSFSTETFQRVYRNSVSASQVLLVFAGYLGMYLRLKGLRSPDSSRLSGRALWRRVKSPWLRMLPWAVVAAFSLAWLWVTREDSVWIIPFALVATLVMLAMLLRRFSPRGASGKIACAVLVILPLVATVAAAGGISAANQVSYGRATVAELNSGNFARAVRDLYAIEPDVQPQNQRVAVTHETLRRAYAVSPALASVRGQVEVEFSGFGDAIDNEPGDGEVNGGEFPWVLRRAARDAGFYESAEKAEGFYGKVADELEGAFASGALQKRATWPSPLMTPWRAEYVGELLPALAGELWQAVSYGDVSCAPSLARGPEDGVRFFEAQANGVAYRPGDPYPLACTVGAGIIWAYRVLGPVLALAGAVCTIAIWTRCVRGHRDFGRRKRSSRLGALALVLLALFLSVLVLLLGLAYSRISSFVPIAYYYYGSPAYPLLLVANLLACVGVVRVRRAGGAGPNVPAARNPGEER